MKKIACLLLSLCFPGFVQAQDAVANTSLSATTTEFSCTQSSSGKCHYLIVSRICEDGIASAGAQKACPYRTIQAFVLRVGEQKELSNLPGDFIYCMKSSATPTVEYCLRYPMKR
ncbi:MAG: hypothetical protein V4634_20010 [Pseudomonadota bacterium]